MERRDDPVTRLFAGADPTQIWLRDMDWSATDLGPVSGWPVELCTMIRVILANRTPMEINWGPDLIRIFNDAARINQGPAALPMLGRPWADGWPDMANEAEPGLRAVLDGHGARYAESYSVLVTRSGYQEETYWTISTSPITCSDGHIGGVLVIPLETTASVLLTRRKRLARDLGGISVTSARTAVAVCQALMRLLERERGIVPCAWIYLPGEAIARPQCVASQGVRPNPANPQNDAVRTAADEHVARVLVTGQPELVTDLRRIFESNTLMPGVLGPRLPDEAMVYPLRDDVHSPPYGVVIIGINPYRRLDDAYQTFLDLAARHMSIMINDARSFEAERHRASALAKISADKTRFVQDISHELRTPLMLLTGPLQSILASESTLSATNREALTSAQAAARELTAQVDTLLSFVRADAGRLDPRFTPTDLATLTTDVAGMFRSRADAAGLQLRIDAPPLHDPVEVDHQMWSQILINLLSNALKFTERGTITVRLRASGTEVQLTVTDTGIGIRADQFDKIFERFYQVTGSILGTGIGLSLVADLAHAHGGDVRVESTPDEGSVFTVGVPTRQPDTALPTTTQPTPPAGVVHSHAVSIREQPRTDAGRADADIGPVAVTEQSPADTGCATWEQLEPDTDTGDGPRRLLLVEDHAGLRTYLCRLLSEDGWSVEAVGTAEAALTVTIPPDLVVSDIVLPGRSGIDLLRALRADPAHEDLPILLLTARAGGEAVAAGLQAGANDYIVKPFDPVELLARARVHYDLTWRRRQAQEQTKNLQTALSSSRELSYAIGILMAQHKLTADESFELLRRFARSSNRKLRVVAEQVVLTGVLPTPEPPQHPTPRT